jgi:signal transduction histidine kinase
VIDPRTLRGRLGLAYAAALLVALVACALLTLGFVDRAQRAALDDRLRIAGSAVATVVDVRHGRVVLDPDDRVQVDLILGNRVNGLIVDRRYGAYASSVTRPPAAIRALADDPASRFATLTSGGAELRALVTPIPPGGPPVGDVVVWWDGDAIAELDRRLALGFALAIPLVAALATVLGGAIAARGLRPLVRLADVASEIEAHDLSGRIGLERSDDELGRLCATFDRMLDRLEAAFARQRQFTSDASHELRAPLSVIRAEADLMLRRRRTPAEYERALRSIADQADDLEALTRELLAAARADAEMPPPGIVDVGRAAGEAAARLAALADQRRVTIRAALAPDARARGDAGALRRVAIALLHNALRFAHGEVELAVARENGSVRLTVGDDGAGFSAAALEHATERFWRDDPARARDAQSRAEEGGSGLGLSIAAAIVVAMGGTLRTANRDGGGALVTVDVPAVL